MPDPLGNTGSMTPLDVLQEAVRVAVAQHPVVEAAGHLFDVVEWLDDDSDRTEEWKQAYWDLRVAMEAHDA